MSRVRILADMSGKHTRHDVYNIWVRVRSNATLFGWEEANGGNQTYSLSADGRMHRVVVPWSPQEANNFWSSAAWGQDRLTAQHILGLGTDPAYFGVQCRLDNNITEFTEAGASLLFPAVCFTHDGTPWVVMIKTQDVENTDGIIDQYNSILSVHQQGSRWVKDHIADLYCGLLPKLPKEKAGVWGFPGKRRRPYVVPDDQGGVWVLWERKEPHGSATTQATGVLCGRRFVEDGWSQPLRIVEGGYMDYVPDAGGVRDGQITVAAQKGTSEEEGRGNVVVLSVTVQGAPVQPADTDFEEWQHIHLAQRRFFIPEDRSLRLRGENYQLLFGDPHTHTALSLDPEGDLVEMLSYARDKAKLDFVATTDNDFIYGHRLTDQAWRLTMKQDQNWSQEGRFIAIPGYEWTQQSWGPVRSQHRSILFASYDQSMLRYSDVQGDPIEALVAWIETTNGIMNSQHPQFYLTDSDREANMEVVSGWGDYINQSDCFHQHLNKGFKVGFIGASDSHHRVPGLGGGLTGLWVTEFTLPAIIEAFGSRRCYATAGARIGLKFWINDAFMGEILHGKGPFGARIAVHAPREVESVEIFGDGRVVASLTDLPASFEEDINSLPRCSWYYAKVTMPGEFPQYPSHLAPAQGPWAWSSPIFIE